MNDIDDWLEAAFEDRVSGSNELWDDDYDDDYDDDEDDE